MQKRTKNPQKTKKQTKVSAPIQLCRCLARWTTLSEFLPIALPTQTSLKKKEENKRTGTSPVATCLEYVSHCGAGSTLMAHNHPSVPVVAAAVAEALYSSPLAGYRSADSLSCGRVGGQRGMGVGGCEEMKQARRRGRARSSRHFRPCCSEMPDFLPP